MSLEPFFAPSVPGRLAMAAATPPVLLLHVLPTKLRASLVIRANWATSFVSFRPGTLARVCGPRRHCAEGAPQHRRGHSGPLTWRTAAAPVNPHVCERPPLALSGSPLVRTTTTSAKRFTAPVDAHVCERPPPALSGSPLVRTTTTSAKRPTAPVEPQFVYGNLQPSS